VQVALLVLLFKIGSRAWFLWLLHFLIVFLLVLLCIAERQFHQAARFAPFASFALHCCVWGWMQLVLWLEQGFGTDLEFQFL